MPDGSIYVVMERLIGRSLADKLARDGIVAPGHAVAIFTQVCRALDAAHKKDVVHRDLKPGNIFLCEDKLAKVLDFGMSKLASAESLTQAGYTLGTPEYMAPEQCIGAQVEPRTDIYALGVMMCLKKRINERPRSASQLEQMLSVVPLEGVPMSYPPGMTRRAAAPQAGTLIREEAKRAQRDRGRARSRQRP